MLKYVEVDIYLVSIKYMILWISIKFKVEVVFLYSLKMKWNLMYRIEVIEFIICGFFSLNMIYIMFIVNWV